MNFTKRQRAFIEFIPVSDVKKSLGGIYAVILVLAPAYINYYIHRAGANFSALFLPAICIDVVLLLLSIPVATNPKKFFGLFHILAGLCGLYISLLLLVCFLIEAVNNSMDIVFILLALVAYISLLLTENILILKADFLKHPRSTTYQAMPIIAVSSVLGMIAYNFFGNKLMVNDMMVVNFLLSILSGILIHTFYRGYLVIRYKYTPSDS